jgi:hypothetical protein
MATLDINGVELLAKHATVRTAELTDGSTRYAGVLQAA